MTERNRGPRRNDALAKKEAKMLEGISWCSWKPVLENRLKDNDLSLPDGENEELLHQFFILRRQKNLGDITNEEFITRIDNLFEGKEKQIFGDPDDLSKPGDPTMKFSIQFTTDRIGRPNY